jgi:hypothetical protein
MFPDPEDVTDAGLIGPLVVAVQEKVVEPMLAAGTKLKLSPLQIVWERLVELFVSTGTGFTVTVTWKVGPAHPKAEGVMV